MVNKMKRFGVVVLTVLFSVSSLFANTTTQSAIEDLDSEDVAKVIAAADFLGSEKEAKKSASAVPKLSERTTHADSKVRVHSVIALGNIAKDLKENEEAVVALSAVLTNEKIAEVRYAALLAAIKIDAKKFEDTLKQISETEEDPIIKDLLSKIEEKSSKK